MLLIGLAGVFALGLAMLALAPVVVTRGAWRVRSPRLALALSHAVTLAGLACVVSTLVWTLAAVTSRHYESGTEAFWLQPTALMLFGWVGLAAAGGLIAMIFTSTEPMTEADRRVRLEFSLLASRGMTYVHNDVRIVIVPAQKPIALSVTGSDQRILIASALTELLNDEELHAVIEHERAHLVQHHGALTRLAQLNRACFAFLPATSELERCTRMLVELIADDTAARHAGAVHLANALWKVGQATADDALLARARRIAGHPPRKSLTTSSRVRRTLTPATAQGQGI